MVAMSELEKIVKKSKKSRLEEDFAAELKLYGLPTPVRQFKFHPMRKWPFDFAWPDRKIALEIHGGIFIPKDKPQGGHNRGAYMEESFEKQNEAIKLGWKVFVFGPSQVRRPKRSQQSSKALEFMYSILMDGQ